MNGLLVDLLNSGDMRTVQNVPRALALLHSQPELAGDMVELLESSEKGIAMRAADCLEKYSRDNPQTLAPYKRDLLRVLKTVPQQEVRWHMALILPRLMLSNKDILLALPIWEADFYSNKSSIVRTASLQAVYDVAERSTAAAKLLDTLLPYALDHGTPAMQARARHL